MDFYRFPHTPHVAWLGEGQPREDKVMSPDEATYLLAHEVIVEEKVDGANIGLSLDGTGTLRIQNRGQYLDLQECHAQFKPLRQWLQTREVEITDALGADLMLFGEWCYARHSVAYTELPDWFLAFDIYDRAVDRFWSVERRTPLCQRLGLTPIKRIASGRFDLPTLNLMMSTSAYSSSPAEGLYIRHDDGDWLDTRAKLVMPTFHQNIGDHWSKRRVEPNQVIYA